MVRPISEKRPPSGVASFVGLVLSSTLWFMLNKSTVLSARRGRALKPDAFSVVRENATRMARIKSQEKITTQARRDWEEVAGRGTPKNIVEVPVEVGVDADLGKDARAGHAGKGEVGVPPCASALVAPLINASALKLYRGREVKPGQKEALSQGAQAGTLPSVPLAHPRQDRLCASACASEAYLRNAEGRRGVGQVRGAQSANEAAEGRRGCWPGGQEKGRARHCVSCVAPVEAVVFPAGQAVHCVDETAPLNPRKVPRLHCVGCVAPDPVL